MGKRPHRLIKEVRKFKDRLSEKYKVDKLILFGSRATGKHKKYSDVDLAIISKDFKNIKFLDRTRGLYLIWDLNYPVDFFCYTPKEFDKLKKQVTVIKEATKEGIEI